MSASAAVTLYVLPYQQKYLLKKFADPLRVRHTPLGMETWMELQRILRRRLERIAPGAHANVVTLCLEGSSDFQLSENQQKRLNGLVHALFARELVDTVDFLRITQGLRNLRGIEEFKQSYGITEDDWGLVAAHSTYYRARRRLAKRHFRGVVNAGVSPRELPQHSGPADQEHPRHLHGGRDRRAQRHERSVPAGRAH